MSEIELINNNIMSNLLSYDIVIVPVTCVLFFFLSGRKFNGMIRLGYFVAIMCIFASIIHRIYIYTYVSDTTDSTIVYTNMMYVTLTVELATFIFYGIFLLIGLFIRNNINTY